MAAAAPAGARAQQTPPLGALQGALLSKREQVAHLRAESERLADLLIRHHLGVSADLETRCALTEPERGRAPAELERALAERQLRLSEQTARLEALRDRVAARREAAKRAPPREPGQLAWAPHVRLDVPGAPPRSGGEPPAAADAAAPDAMPPAAPLGETAGPPSGAGESDVPPAPRGAPVLIRGTTDPALLGKALFMAGRYEEARAELERAAAAPDAALAVLFDLARCYEKLGEHARADGAFLQIEALDEKRGGAGHWASTARTARQHMNWAKDHGSWRPTTLQR